MNTIGDSERAAMQEWIQAQVAAGLPAFAGTSISGTLVLKQELLNEWLANWLRAHAQRDSAMSSGLNVGNVVRTIKSATVRAEPGRVLVDFSVAV